MVKDKNGNELKVGDTIKLTGKVSELIEGDGYTQVAFRTLDGRHTFGGVDTVDIELSQEKLGDGGDKPPNGPPGGGGGK